MSKFKIIFAFLILIFTFLILIFNRLEKGKTSKVDGVFTKCLADKGIVMYGADWCPHCQNEKKAFGDSFQFVSYVECPKDPNRCLSAGIAGYPTWILPDGKKLVGEQGPKKLSEASGCPLP